MEASDNCCGGYFLKKSLSLHSLSRSKRQPNDVIVLLKLKRIQSYAIGRGIYELQLQHINFWNFEVSFSEAPGKRTKISMSMIGFVFGSPLAAEAHIYPCILQ